MSDNPSLTEAESAPITFDTFLLALPGLICFPGMLLPLQSADPDVIRTAEAAFETEGRRIAVVPRQVGEAQPAPLREYGAMAVIPRLRRLSDGSVQMLLQGAERVRLVAVTADTAPLRAIVAPAPEVLRGGNTIDALTRTLQQTFTRISELLPQHNEELQQAVESVEGPLQLVYLLAVTIRMDPEDRYLVLAHDDIEAKLRVMLRVMHRELELLELGRRIQSEAAGQIEQAQREFFLRQQLRAIRSELGEGDDSAEIDELRQRIDAAGLPQEAESTLRRELRRLEMIPPAAAEHHVIRSYIELALDLPWHALTEDNLDIRRAKRILDEDHYGLEHVKDRILEYLAVRSLKPDLRGPILCFVGPPGVGKTSLGQSIARSLGRKFVRISLGGVHDEAEIRGHRRTYIGAMPGRIIEQLRRAESRNPVFMLDEIDKVSASFHGDPSAALLEVLDPAQNHQFRDNYLDLSFDLSQVLFIATANVLSTVQPALRDRLESIEIEGYTEAEKMEIARRHLIPRQAEAHGLVDDGFRITAPALRHVIRAYTRESGVRNLERTIATLCRKVARRVAEGETGSHRVRKIDLAEMLGPETVYAETARRVSRPGVVTGLSVTPTGGEVLFVEAIAMPGEGELLLTGQLGDVMKESAQAAFSYLRANAERLGLDAERLRRSDIHLHVPAGAVPKDGPSAGVTMATAMLSALLGVPAREDVAMTGELTLTGQVLPVGGVREKILAARRAGITTVLFPERNSGDLVRLAEDVRATMRLEAIETVDEAFQAALALPPGGSEP